MMPRTCICRTETVCFRRIDDAGPAVCWPCASGNHSHGYGAATAEVRSPVIEQLVAIQVAAEQVVAILPPSLDKTTLPDLTYEVPIRRLIVLQNAVRAAREG